MAPHLIWDWNGTLLCDTDVVLEATNEALAKLHVDPRQGAGARPDQSVPTSLSRLGAGPLTAAQYRAAFARPLRRFYTNVFGRDVSHEEFLRLDELFHEAYLRRMVACRLSQGALEALARWRALGRTQSLLSLWTHDELVARVAEFGLTDYFVRVDGRRDNNLDDLEGKTEPLRRHLAQLGLWGARQSEQAAPTRDIVLVGDTLDDAAAARVLGMGCVLFAGGMNEAAQLEATGVPVVHTLVEAVEMVDRLVA